jgi:hypothetical protein
MLALATRGPAATFFSATLVHHSAQLPHDRPIAP